MKSKYFFRTLILIVFISLTSVLINYCSDPATSPTAEALTSISGVIVNFDQGNNVVLKSVITYNNMDFALDSSVVSSSGNFSIKLPVPKDSLLSQIRYSNSTYCNANVTVNPPETKGATLKLLLYKFTLIGEIVQSDSVHSPVQQGDYVIRYEYYDRSTTISGQTTCNFISFTNYNYNITGVKGWNKVRYIYMEHTPTYDTFVFDNTIPKDSKWTYWIINNN